MTEAISQAEFDDKLSSNELVLAFVGMSNCGKSWSAKRLVTEQNFERLDCDGIIQTDVDDILRNWGYLKDDTEPEEAMAEWMGQPPDARYPDREATYLQLETDAMENILDKYSNDAPANNTIIDTTGSIVHTTPEICSRLGDIATVVLFDVTAQLKKIMFKEYKEKPKPLVWGEAYKPVSSEKADQTLERCYYELLDHRTALYKKMAHVVIPREVKYKFANTDELLDYIRLGLPS